VTNVEPDLTLNGENFVSFDLNKEIEGFSSDEEKDSAQEDLVSELQDNL
jgi:hypothetical protein